MKELNSCRYGPVCKSMHIYIHIYLCVLCGFESETSKKNSFHSRKKRVKIKRSERTRNECKNNETQILTWLWL